MDKPLTGKQLEWMGRHLEVLTRDELVEALRWCLVEVGRCREHILLIRPYVDWQAVKMDQQARQA